MAAVIETALSTYLDALDDEDKATAKLYVQKAAQAADEARQLEDCRGLASQTRQSQPSNIPTPLGMKTVRTWTSQRPVKADSVRCSSKRSFRG